MNKIFTQNTKPVQRLSIYIIGCLVVFQPLHAQNVGIGVTKPTRARLEVWGASGAGTTSGIFGDERGISLQRNYAAIGFNQYRDDASPASNGRYMNLGYAAVWRYVHDDLGLSQGLSLDIFPSGNYNAAIPAGVRAWNFTSNNRFQILTAGAFGGGILDVGRGTGYDGTAMFSGTEYNSHFNYGVEENTYIRGGKGASNVYLQDVPNGKVIFGDGGTRLGVNTNYYVPTSVTLEVRQSNGGLELTNANYTAQPWEWRVAAGSPAHFFLYFNNSAKAYFSYVNGSLNTVSDGRVKSDIQSLEPVLERLMQLEPVSYKMKDALEGQPRFNGFIAQRVEPLFPTLVSHDMSGKAGLLGLDYGGFGVIALKGVQEEQQQIDQIDQDLSDADKRLRTVEKKLAALQVNAHK